MTASVETVRDYLADSMATGLFTAGQKLPTERELAERFSVSRTVVREAMVMLEINRSIVRQVGRGTFVAEATPSSPVPLEFSPADLIEARTVIESELAALAVLNAGDREIEAIRAACESLDPDATTQEFEFYDCAFHRAIAVAAKNALLLAGYDLIATARMGAEWRRLKAFRHASRPERRGEVLSEHRAIVDAIEGRDGAEARKEMLQHLYRVRMNLLGR
ncbi:FCD domain-containing protein [Aurantimonas sp. A2-1-M11]|uniref:FadR/GntR family transcriptional regulator n=1 Tax=Aurantimonas sp. A2-1-M11 TaxID=3113712 RepID=UPI002F946FF6